MTRDRIFEVPQEGATIELFEKIRRWLSNAEESSRDRLDQPSLRRQVVAGIMALRHRDPLGVDTLPRIVAVDIEVGGGSFSVVRGFIDDPRFDADVTADLANRLVGMRPEALPVCLYEVRAGEKVAVEVREAREGVLLWLEIDGGDRHGHWQPFEASQAQCHMGRGPWHGDDQLLANDLVLSDDDKFVSRRAALLRRAGSRFEIAARDQGDALAVIRSSGKRVRPTHVRSRTVTVGAGDVIEFNDGSSVAVRLRLHGRGARRPSTTGAGAS